MGNKVWILGLVLVLALVLAGCSAEQGEPAVVEPEPTEGTAADERVGGAAAVVEEPAAPSAANWDLTQVRWETYSTEHGLPNNRIDTLAIDTSGALWVGTDRGGGRFDQGTWVDVVPPPTGVIDIAFDAQGRAWLADGRGVEVYNAGALTTYGYAEGLGSVQSEALIVDREGRVWVAMITDNHGCVGGEGAGGIYLFEDEEWAWFDTTELFSSSVSDVAEDAEGSLWIVGEGGLARYDGVEWEALRLPVEGEDTQILTCVTAAADGRVWLGTKNLGLWIWDRGTWSQYLTGDGLAGDTVWEIAFDDAGRAWIGTSGGLNTFDGETWITYMVDDGLAYNDVRSLAFTDEGLWVGTWRGLNYMRFGELE